MTNKRTRGRPPGPCYPNDKKLVPQIMHLLAQHVDLPVRNAIRSLGVTNERDVRRLQRHVDNLLESQEVARKRVVANRPVPTTGGPYHHFPLGIDPAVFKQMAAFRDLFTKTLNNPELVRAIEQQRKAQEQALAILRQMTCGLDFSKMRREMFFGSKANWSTTIAKLTGR